MKDSKFKRVLLSIWDWYSITKSLTRIKKDYSLSIMPPEKTVAYIKENSCSIARYGDGDLALMMKTHAEEYQNISDGLAVALKNVFANSSRELLICMPYPLISTRKFTKEGKNFWRRWAVSTQEEVVQTIRGIMKDNYYFGDSFVSRPYTAYKSSRHAKKMFPLLKSLWEGRDIIIIEGNQTRLGVGNDLFANTKSIKRILCPAENAFDVYEKILQTVLANREEELIIMALGPTATVLASDLSKKGIQALDLGHIDIQYEWFLNGVKFKPIPGKYTNETIGGREIGACTDSVYLSQIIKVIN